MIWERFALFDVDDAEAAEVAVFRAEWPVNNRYLLDQLRAERLQSTKVALAVALRSLVLLNIIDQHLQTAVYPAVIEIKAKSPNFQRLSAPFMLPGIYAGVQLLEDLIVSGEQGSVEDLAVSEINRGFERLRRYDDALSLL